MLDSKLDHWCSIIDDLPVYMTMLLATAVTAVTAFEHGNGMGDSSRQGERRIYAILEYFSAT